jgi:hypothetical protein
MRGGVVDGRGAPVNKAWLRSTTGCMRPQTA